MISNDTRRQLILEDIDPLECNEFTVKKRDGHSEPFDASLIQKAVEKAFKAEEGIDISTALTPELQEISALLTEQVLKEVIARAVKGEELEIELIQDAVENRLMDAGYYKVARRYIVYREDRKRARLIKGEEDNETPEHMQVRYPDGTAQPLDPQKIRRTLVKACTGFEDRCNANELTQEVLKIVYNGVTPAEIENGMMMTSRAGIEREPAYGYVAARLLLKKNYRDAWQRSVESYEFDKVYRTEFANYIKAGVEYDLLSDKLQDFDLELLGEALFVDRDSQLNYLGAQTLYDRYLLHIEERRIETPQYLWMRVAMGLALEEENKNEKAVEFYELLSSFRFMSSTPTLFNAGTQHSQLSSCYLLTIDDDLGHIFKTIGDDAQLSKWAGGLGNDWTNIRATGSRIKGTNGKSQGIVPFLKVANDTAVAVNQGGKRKGAMCAYLETWHLDLEDFIDLRKNTGDERRRTHDMHTANWIPDLFMKRVKENGLWTLFSPSDVPDLHHLCGAAFETAYAAYEAQTQTGEIKLFKQVEAMTLWRKMLTSLFETGHPWITFKDPSNVRSPQQHAGVVHSSNLCTEILLNTSNTEAAVCNLGSINLPRHFNEAGEIDLELLQRSVTTAIRMLDNVININYYPTAETKNSNYKHRPIGLGSMGFQDALFIQGIPYASEAAITFADQIMEQISYHAIMASAKLAEERGAYESYEGSLWSQGILPIDSIKLLEEARGGFVDMDCECSMDWQPVRAAIKAHGMRNSNCMAIAPTATIANITGVSQSIEPAYKHLYVKSNLSGEFTVANPYLVEELKKLKLWDSEMIDDLKYFDGSIQEIERIPDEIKTLYKCAFEIEPQWIIDCGSRRQKWIDMGQSLNLYIAAPDGRKLSEMYMRAWEKGLKTTYYLRSTAATQVEKSTMDINRRGLQPRWMKNESASSNVTVDRTSTVAPKQCSIEDPDCEACQ